MNPLQLNAVQIMRKIEKDAYLIGEHERDFRTGKISKKTPGISIPIPEYLHPHEETSVIYRTKAYYCDEDNNVRTEEPNIKANPIKLGKAGAGRETLIGGVNGTGYVDYPNNPYSDLK